MSCAVAAVAARHSEAAESPAFPLRVAPGRTYLEDVNGRPVLIHGDSAWSLIAELRFEEAKAYLEDRRDRGFNAVLVNLLERKFATRAPANIYGEPPFLKPDDFTTPNEAYFEHVDRVLRLADELGMLVMLAPAYMGANGGDEGWYQAMSTNGVGALRRYGQFVGQRYSGFSNILWVNGCDYNPPDKALARVVAEEIRKAQPSGLHTAHCGPEVAPADFWQGESWLNVNNAYTYGPVEAMSLRQYGRRYRMPFFLIESAYENELGTTEQRLRAQAYQALLCGACGQVFGNSPIWHFGSRHIPLPPTTWRQALGARGSLSMQHVRRLFDSLPWWLLAPDVDHRLLLGQLGTGHERVVAACASDGSCALTYLPNTRTISVDTSRLRGSQVIARWYDPSSGKYLPIANGRPIARQRSDFAPPGANEAGFLDWVLELRTDE